MPISKEVLTSVLQLDVDINAVRARTVCEHHNHDVTQDCHSKHLDYCNGNGNN